MTAPDRTGGVRPSDGLRVRSVMGRWVGGGYVLYFLVSLPDWAAQSAVTARWWTPLAVVSAFGPGWVMLGATVLGAGIRTVAACSAACGAGYLVAVGSWFLAWNQSVATSAAATWLAYFPGLASLAMCLGRRQWLAAPHLVIATLAVSAANDLGLGRDTFSWPRCAAVLWSLAFSAVFVAAGWMAVRTGDRLDRTRVRAHRVAAQASAARARAAARAHFDALVHDRVLAVMLAVEPGASEERTVTRARELLTGFDREFEGSSAGTSFVGRVDGGRSPNGHPSSAAADASTLPDLCGAVRAAVARVDEAVAVWVRGDAALVPLTAEQVRAFADATAEATRNALRHGGIGVTAWVEIVTVEGAVRVTTADDGCGFDPGAARAGRLGIPVSIEARMAAVGGTAGVHSEPGRGTRVVLAWPG